MNTNLCGWRLMVVYMLLWCMSFTQYNAIISFSLAPSKVSSSESRVLSDRISETIDAVAKKKTKTKAEIKLRDGVIHHVVRKSAHIFNFFVFSFINLMLFFTATDKKYVKRVLMAILIIGFFGAVADEVVQLFIEGRTGCFADVLVDYVGVCLACLGFCVILRHRLLFVNKKVI